MVDKTRRSISKSGAYLFLIIWGTAWLFGFSANHFFTGKTVGIIWGFLDGLGGIWMLMRVIRK